MNPFITYTETIDGVKRYFILQKAFPNYVGEIKTFHKERSICYKPISGHMLWVDFAGRIDGNFVPAYKTALQEMDAIFEQMANWYYEHEILPNPKKYLKFKINDTSS